MATTGLDKDQDRKLNPGDADYDKKVGNDGAYVSSGLDQLEAYANDPNNQDSSIKEQEESGRDGFYRPSATPGSGGKAKLSGNFLKKRGPLAMIITVLLGGGGIMGLLFSPAIGLVHMKETLTGDLNDQLAALDKRTNKVLRTKLKGMTTGMCTGVKIKCKFSKMSNRQIKRFERAGFKIETSDGKTFTGRNRVTGITTPDGHTYRDPGNFTRDARRTPRLGRQLVKALNPGYIGFASRAFTKATGKLIISKKSVFKSGTEAGMADDLNSATRGLDVDPTVADSRFITDEDGNKQFVDEDGNKHGEDSDRYRNAQADLESKGNSFRNKVANSNGFKKLGNVAKGMGILGAADIACTVYNTSRAVAAASKVIRSLQLAQYSMVFLNTADKIKAGTATPEEVEYLGDILNDRDMRETIVGLSAAETGDGWSYTENPNENPNYGKNAYDSAGFRTAAYGDTPILNAQAQQFMIGGGLSGTMSRVTDDALNLIGGDRQKARDVCGTIQHPITRGAGMVVGIVVGVFTGGASALVGAGLSAGVALALPLLEAYLVDIITGEIVGEYTKGVDAGDAIFAGTASIMGSAAQQHGLKPLTNDELEDYIAVTNEVKAQYAEIAKLDAKDAPFDIMNQYSFLGSLARMTYPMMNSTTSNLSGFVASIPKLLLSPITNTTNTVKASSYNPDRFNKCSDSGYADLDIAADIFCNVRYGLTTKELSLDTEEVVDYMIAGGYIDQESGEPLGDDYKDFIKNCVDREDGWGESTEENGSIGSECMRTDDQTSKFRVFTIDNIVSDAMDGEEIQSTPVIIDDSGSTASSEYGLTMEQGKRMVNQHRVEVGKKSGSSLIPTSSVYYPNECVTFSKYFLAKYRGRKDVSLGNGKNVVSTLSKEGYSTGTQPKVFAVASFSAGQGSITNNYAYGHTGVVIDVYEDGSILLAEAGNGFTNKVNVRKLTTTQLKNSKTTYAYVGDKITQDKLNELLQL